MFDWSADETELALVEKVDCEVTGKPPPIRLNGVLYDDKVLESPISII